MKRLHLYVEDMLDYLNEALEIAKGDRSAITTLRAIEYNLIVLGEAANKLGPELRKQYPTIPWRKIIDFRNLVTHGYDAVDINIVWEIVDHHLPPLEALLKQMLQEIKYD